jgi:PhoPQ-activated pathogenicity-related protein
MIDFFSKTNRPVNCHKLSLILSLNFIYSDLPELLCWFPMVKSALRAMDMTEEIVNEKFGKSISKWAVTGGSKRGWTTWLVSGVDPERVVLSVPVVADMLNFSKTMHMWYRNLGAITVAQIGYWADRVHENIDNPHFGDYADPIIYNERMTMTKMIISGKTALFKSERRAFKL